MRVVGYVRVSSEEQAAEGVSLAAQEEKVRGYAALYGLDLVALEVDAGASAKTLQRPALGRALARLESGAAEGLVIAKLDRLTRSVADLATLLDRHFGERAGHQLFSVADSIDTRTAAGRLVLNVLMSVAQWERETIVERTRDALAHKRSKGERVGQVPYGFDLGPDGKTLIPSPAEGDVLAWMRQARETGASHRVIAASLNAQNIPSKNGRTWAHPAVSLILSRHPRPETNP